MVDISLCCPRGLTWRWIIIVTRFTRILSPALTDLKRTKPTEMRQATYQASDLANIDSGATSRFVDNALDFPLLELRFQSLPVANF